VAAGTGGRVRIACAETMTGWLLVPVIRSWRRRFPEVELDLKEYTSADRMLEVLLAGGADITVAPPPSRTDEHVELLGEEEMVVVASPEHRFATMDAVPLRELADEPLVHYDPSNGIASWVDRFAAERDVVLPRPTLRTGSPRTAAQLAAAGVGVAIVPISALTPPPDGIVRSFDPPELRDVIVVVAAPHDSLVARFVADLKRRGLPSARLAADGQDRRVRITAVPPPPKRVRAGSAISTLPDDAGLAGLTVRAASGGPDPSGPPCLDPARRRRTSRLNGAGRERRGQAFLNESNGRRCAPLARHERKGPLCPSARSSSSTSTRPSLTSRRSGRFSTASSTIRPPCGCGSRT
jgi:hypothetical protein